LDTPWGGSNPWSAPLGERVASGYSNDYADGWGSGTRTTAHMYRPLDMPGDNVSDGAYSNPLLQAAPQAAAPKEEAANAASRFRNIFTPQKPKPLLWGGQSLDKIFDPFFAGSDSNAKPDGGIAPYNPFLNF
jgi:hypothetical protein